MRLILTGPRQGETVTLNGYTFTDGVLDMDALQLGEDAQLGLAKYMGRCYAAYLEGSKELEEAQHGQCQLQETEGGGTPKAVPSDVPPQGEGTSEEAPDDGGKDVDGPEGGSMDTVPNGDGHEHAGVHPEEQKIVDALKELDPDNDDHWTKAGKPAVSVVAEIAGIPALTRKMLDAVDKDYGREQAQP